MDILVLKYQTFVGFLRADTFFFDKNICLFLFLKKIFLDFTLFNGGSWPKVWYFTLFFLIENFPKWTILICQATSDSALRFHRFLRFARTMNQKILLMQIKFSLNYIQKLSCRSESRYLCLVKLIYFLTCKHKGLPGNLITCSSAGD